MCRRHAVAAATVQNGAVLGRVRKDGVSPLWWRGLEFISAFVSASPFLFLILINAGSTSCLSFLLVLVSGAQGYRKPEQNETREYQTVRNGPLYGQLRVKQVESYRHRKVISFQRVYGLHKHTRASGVCS